MAPWRSLWILGHSLVKINVLSCSKPSWNHDLVPHLSLAAPEKQRFRLTRYRQAPWRHQPCRKILFPIPPLLVRGVSCLQASRWVLVSSAPGLPEDMTSQNTLKREFKIIYRQHPLNPSWGEAKSSPGLQELWASRRFLCWACVPTCQFDFSMLYNLWYSRWGYGITSITRYH